MSSNGMDELCQLDVLQDSEDSGIDFFLKALNIYNKILKFKKSKRVNIKQLCWVDNDDKQNKGYTCNS